MGLSNFFSSLFGKAKQTAESASENISEFADNAMDKATEVVADVKVKVEEVAETASAKLEEMGIPEQVSQLMDTAKDKLAEATDWAEKKT